MEQTLSKFAEGKKQREIAKLLGRSQGAVSQMLRSGRDIRVVIDEHGSVSWYEIKGPRTYGACKSIDSKELKTNGDSVCRTKAGEDSHGQTI